MQRKRKGNDRQAYQSHIKRQEAYERGWLDDADEEYPDYGEAEAYDTEKMAGLVRGQPVCPVMKLWNAEGAGENHPENLPGVKKGL